MRSSRLAAAKLNLANPSRAKTANATLKSKLAALQAAKAVSVAVASRLASRLRYMQRDACTVTQRPSCGCSPLASAFVCCLLSAVCCAANSASSPRATRLAVASSIRYFRLASSQRKSRCAAQRHAATWKHVQALCASLCAITAARNQRARSRRALRTHCAKRARQLRLRTRRRRAASGCRRQTVFNWRPANKARTAFARAPSACTSRESR